MVRAVGVRAGSVVVGITGLNILRVVPIVVSPRAVGAEIIASPGAVGVALEVKVDVVVHRQLIWDAGPVACPAEGNLTRRVTS